MRTMNFDLPTSLEAGEPPEARGLSRDAVRLMVSHYGTDQVRHTRFRELACFLNPGDVLVINTSGTMNAALPATRADGTPLELHLSTRLPADLWVVEVRQLADAATAPFYEAQAGETLHLPGSGSVTLLTPHNSCQRLAENGRVRLWIATLSLPEPLSSYLAAHGFPIRYSYVKEQWPLAAYQTVYATEFGSAEMPSAGRAFTPELVTKLVAQGVQIAPLILHTGVASLEEHEMPYEEFYRVPAQTAEMVNRARQLGKRVIAVGTTAVRALETVTDEQGITRPGEGWTSLVITPQRGLRAVDGLLTGLHEPKATHLAMLAALAGQEHLRITYAEALAREYLWHEFGDLHLILP
ncbi:MAG: S-adenosylmethionine:tRNA ribosyltransferase-isomerase [Anaerolineae bacterium]|nr:S-adenosylmethionine:tRNA ribosyltransferase-isomerase [Anaerolineae bacterium]